MIVENDCLILQIFQMRDGETREEVPMNVMILHRQNARHSGCKPTVRNWLSGLRGPCATMGPPIRS